NLAFPEFCGGKSIHYQILNSHNPNFIRTSVNDTCLLRVFGKQSDNVDCQPESFVEPDQSFSLKSYLFQNLLSRFRVWSNDVDVACPELASSVGFYGLVTDDVYGLRFLPFKPLS